MEQLSAIGVLGLGAQGLLLVPELRATGRRVLVWEPRAERRKGLPRSAGQLEIAGSLADIAAECALVVSCLEDPSGFRDALLGVPGREGLQGQLVPDSLAIDLIPKDPRALRSLIVPAGLTGLHLADGVVVRAQGALPRLLVAGFAATLARLPECLAGWGSVERVGEAGAAHALAMLAAAKAAIEAVAEAEIAGLASALKVDRANLARVGPGHLGGGEAVAMATALAQRSDKPALLLAALAGAAEPVRREAS